MKTLTEYFEEAYQKGIIDHSLRVSIDEGGYYFYIHPQNHDGETLDFQADGNELKPNPKVKRFEP